MCWAQAPRLGVRWACLTFLTPAPSSPANCPTERHTCGAAHAGLTHASNQSLFHFASSIKLSHCCFCTAAVPWVPPPSRFCDGPFKCMSQLKPSPPASCTDLRRLFWERGFSCLPTWKQVRGEAEEVLSCSRTHSHFVTCVCCSPVGLCASGQGDSPGGRVCGAPGRSMVEGCQSLSSVSGRLQSALLAFSSTSTCMPKSVSGGRGNASGRILAH